MNQTTEKALTILIVEDNVDHIELILRAFNQSNSNIKIKVFKNIADARQSIESNSPSLVIADLNLPDGKGTDLICLSPHENSYPVILMTSFGDENIAADAIKAGAIDYVVKSSKVFAEFPARINLIMREWQHTIDKYEAEKRIQKSEKRLSAAQRMAHIGDWELNIATNDLQWSDEIYHIFEIDQQEFGASYDTFLNSIHPDDREKVNQAYTESLKNKTHYSIKHRLLMNDGRIKHVLEQCETFYNDEGKPLRSSGTIQDITELVNMEEQLQRTEKMDALGKLTGGIAHDYNNILGIVMGYAEQIHRHIHDTEKVDKYCHKIIHSAERGAKLAKKLLLFSKHRQANISELNVNRLLNDMADLLKKTLTVSIKFSFKLSKNLWLVELDEGDLEDSIINMVINAGHAMESGGELTISTENLQLNSFDAEHLGLSVGDYVRLSIVDTGSGMNAEIKEKIFDPFFTTKDELGTGLGLSQVYGFVERSSGAITVYSELDMGSCFMLYFPKSKQCKNRIQTQNTLKEAVLNLQGTETLLIVDDEKDLVELAKNIFITHGYRVFTAYDGKQALHVLEKETVDLIVSDVIMPNMGGFQLAKNVQKNYPKIKMQMVSGFTDEHHNVTDADPLHQNILYKPYTSNDLLTRVRHLLNETSVVDALLNRNILVMDDDEDVQALFEINLKKLGCHVVHALDGETAIELYKNALDTNERIDVIIADLSIPGGIGGKELAIEVRKIHSEAKIIVASGHLESPEMMSPQEHGFDGVLEKKFNRKNIESVLKQVLLG